MRARGAAALMASVSRATVDVRGQGLNSGGVVEGDHGVEADQVTLLVVGHFGEGHPQNRAGGLLGEAEPGG